MLRTTTSTFRHSRSLQHHGLFAALLPVLILLILSPSRLAAQASPAIVGRIEGSDITVKTAVGEGVEIDGGPTVVASGSDVTVRSKQALLLLDGGGEISVCGPAHFTLLKSAGAVTLALDYGRVRPSLDSPATLTIYTPMIVATPVAIGGERRDTTLGLDQNGAMCILTSRGAMRIEQQLTGQSLLIPQGGAVGLAGGQIDLLHASAGSCSCDFSQAKASPPPTPVRLPPPSSASPDISALRHAEETESKGPEATSDPAPAAEPPVYTVIVPPLTFDATSPAPPPDPSPEAILLVREVRVRPTVIFHGHVNPAPVDTAADSSRRTRPRPVRTPEGRYRPAISTGHPDAHSQFLSRDNEPLVSSGCGDGMALTCHGS